MKQKIVLGLFGVLATIILCSNASGYGGNRTGATGTTGCGSCHGSTTGIGTTIELDSGGVPVTSYYPGLAYTVKISATNNTGLNLPKFGCELSVVKALNAGTTSAALAGTWGTPPANMSNRGLYIEHTARLSPASGTGSNGTVYTALVPWTAPVTGTGAVRLYGVLNAVNANNGDDSGDKYQAATAVTITEASVAAAPVASLSISITSGTNPTCSGVPVTFTATPANGGSAPTYQWKVGTAVVGTGATYTSSTLTNGQVVTCVMTSNLSGVTGSPATSNAIIITVNTSVIDSVNITTSANNICAGTSVTFTAHPFNGGTPTYQWLIGTAVVGTGAIYTSSTLANGNQVKCIMTPTGTCVSPTTATSNVITMTVNPTVTDSVRISVSANPVCAGVPVTFTATPYNGGNPSYQWYVGSAPVATGSTFVSSSLANGSVVTCVMTPTGSCVSPATATSNAITMTVNSSAAPTIAISGTAAVCSGSADTVTAQITNGGASPVFAWTVNGNPAGTNSTTLILPSITSASAIVCAVTSSSTCGPSSTTTSSIFNVAVTPIVTPTISITTPHSSICQGDLATFTSAATGQGANPAYQWFVNATPVATSSSYSSSSLTDGDAITCRLTSDATCASPSQVTSTAINMTVHAAPAATLVPSGAMAICAGDSVRLVADGGNAFQWSTAAVTDSVWASQAATYTVTVTDANGCTATPSAAIVSVNTPATPVITQAVNVLTVTPAAVSYQWQLNGNILGGADTTQSITMTQSGSYQVTTIDSSGCSAVSTGYILTYTFGVGIKDLGSDLDVRLYPVPTHGSFTIDMPVYTGAQVAIYDIYGHNLHQQPITAAHQEISSLGLAPALYFVEVSTGSRSQIIKMQIIR